MKGIVACGELNHTAIKNNHTWTVDVWAKRISRLYSLTDLEKCLEPDTWSQTFPNSNCPAQKKTQGHCSKHHEKSFIVVGQRRQRTEHNSWGGPPRTCKGNSDSDKQWALTQNTRISGSFPKVLVQCLAYRCYTMTAPISEHPFITADHTCKLQHPKVKGEHDEPKCADHTPNVEIHFKYDPNIRKTIAQSLERYGLKCDLRRVLYITRAVLQLKLTTYAK